MYYFFNISCLILGGGGPGSGGSLGTTGSASGGTGPGPGPGGGNGNGGSLTGGPGAGKTKPYVVRDVFITPSFDELDAVAVDVKGDPRRLSSQHLQSIREKG